MELERSCTLLALPVPDYVAFDVETTGFSPEEDRIIEVAFVRFENGVPAKKWSSLVRPGREVGLKVLRLTGIPPEELAGSPDIASVCGEIEEFRGGLPLVGHNPEFDVSFLSRAIQGFPGVPVYDTLELARIVFPGFKSYKLGDLAQQLDIELCDAHRACDDAEATGMIFGAIQRKIVRLPRAVREKIIRIMGKDWVSACLFDRRESPGHQLSLFLEESAGRSLPAETRLLPEMLDEGKLEQVPVDWLEGLFEAQQRYTFVDFPLEALTPGNIAASLSSHVGPVVVAADVETLSLSDLGVSFLSVPEDYLCLLRANLVEDFARCGLLDHLDVEAKQFLSTIVVWRDATRDGLFREIQVVGKAHALSRELSCSGFPDCQGHCPYAEECFYSKALDAVAGSRVILTPKYNCFDVSTEVNPAGCIVLGFDDLGDIWERKQPRLNLERLREALEDLGCTQDAERVDRLILKSLDALGSNHDMVVPDDIVRALASVHREVEPVLSRLRQELRHSSSAFVGQPVDPPVMGMNLRRLEYWMEQIQAILTGDSSSMYLLERGYGVARGIIAGKALWPAIEAKHALVERFGNVVLVSPNAGFVSQFEGLRRLYGFEPGDMVHHMGHTMTQADADSGSLLVSIDKGQRMSYSEHLELTAEFLKQLALQSSENVLCLCPSYSFIRNLSSHIAGFLESEQIAVFAQGVDGGPRVLEHLSEPGTLVLARFGVDILDNTSAVPRILVIPKIPFLPPNTITDLRQREVSGLGKSGFIEVSVLPVVLALRTYMESLSRIAGKTAVILLDPKILPGQSGWGRDFMAQFHDVRSVVCPQQIGITQALKWVSSGNSNH